MNIVLLTAHSILEYDELRIFHSLGHSVLSIGAYIDPANPSDDKRPALPDIPPAPQELRDLVADQMVAKSALPDEVLEWADAVIVHFFTVSAPDDRPGWLNGNWAKLREHNVRAIWRTTGQSNHYVEAATQAMRAEGLEIVRYSPKERNIPYFAGEDALIRFGKNPADWYGWTGEDPVVANVSQNMVERGGACGLGFWQEATKGLSVSPAGPGSEMLGGVGILAYDDMRAYLRRSRCYLYTGTQPASYTLGLIEALMTGVPVVSIGPKAYGGDSYLAELFEGHEIAPMATDDPIQARGHLQHILSLPPNSENREAQRQRVIDCFSADAIAAQWAAYL